MHVAVPICAIAFISTGPLQLAAPGVTSLTNPAVRHTTPAGHHVVLKRGGVTAIVVDNEAVDTADCPVHRAGYNGLAVLRLDAGGGSMFVPAYAGLNLEHIHDGTRVIDRTERFEPRKASMQLRLIDEHTVELHQPPTPHFRLESCGRYQILDDGTIEYTFECIPRERTFGQGYIGLFWASYIEQPESTAIRFFGRKAGANTRPELVEHMSRKHGVDSTHPPANLSFEPKVDPEFSLTLVNHRSAFVYTEPWYYGTSRERSFVQMFRPRDQVWFAQSPSGGGNGNHAWDFQWFIPDYRVGEAYGFVMRAALVPKTGHEDVLTATRRHRELIGAVK